MPELKEVIPWVITIGIFLIGFFSNKAFQGKQDGREIESIKSDISYIKKSVDELKVDKKQEQQAFNDMRLEITRIQGILGAHDSTIAELKEKLDEQAEKGGYKIGR